MAHARRQGLEKGEIRIIGYYSKQDGLDCVWLVTTTGNYDWTTEHEWLYEKFEVLEFSDETDLYGEQRDIIQGLNAEQIEKLKHLKALKDQPSV
jgi:hypothetical protein